MQGARTQYTVLALYLASKCDHHYMVRDRAKEALDQLLLCNRQCYKELFASADAAVKKLRPYYNPTEEQCVHLELCNCCIVVHVCKLEKKEEKKEECLIPINIVEDGLCPTCHAHAVALPPPGAPLLVPPGAPGGPEPLTTAPTPALPPAR
jgi:hypothetical protein